MISLQATLIFCFILKNQVLIHLDAFSLGSEERSQPTTSQLCLNGELTVIWRLLPIPCGTSRNTRQPLSMQPEIPIFDRLGLLAQAVNG